ncbi:hypothetical protein KAH51_19680, partial [Proteus vulgaris]|nr:hypothetical protein [Proteus vulgaris]
HLAADKSLPDDFRDYLPAVYMLSMDATGITVEHQWAKRFEAMGLEPEAAGLIAMALPGMINGGSGKGNKGTTPKQPNSHNPVNIATNFTKTPQAIWGRSTEDIAQDFKAAGYQVNVRQSTRGSGQAVIIEVKGHPEISQIQYHPGGGRHGGSYYKVSTTTQGTMKVVDPSTYKTMQNEKATIIDKTKE